MADAATRPSLSDEPVDAAAGRLSVRRRQWLLTVASTNVLLVMASMVALNAALGDLAVQTSATQTQLTWNASMSR